MMFAAAAFALAPISAQADSAKWIDVNYHSRQDIDLACPVAIQCTVEFAAGEVMGRWFVSNGRDWNVAFNYEVDASGNAKPQLIVEPNSRSRANLIFASRNTGRQYRIMLVPADDQRPVYVVFHYPPSEQRRTRPPKVVAQVVPPKPLDDRLHDAMNAACDNPVERMTADSAIDKRGRLDSVMASIRPVVLCGDRGHTYFSLPQGDSNASDLPIILLDTKDGPVHVVPHYAEKYRQFTVDSTANIIIRITAGKRIVDCHVYRTPREAAAR